MTLSSQGRIFGHSVVSSWAGDGEAQVQTFADAYLAIAACFVLAMVMVPLLPEVLLPGATLRKWGNDLRQTYRTIAQTVGIGDLDIHLLMNHAVAGVNAGYITRSKLLSDHLRQQQETISGKMTDAVRSRVKRHQERAMGWPLLPARTVLKNGLRLVENGAATKPSMMVGATRERANRTWSEVAAGAPDSRGSGVLGYVSTRVAGSRPRRVER